MTVLTDFSVIFFDNSRIIGEITAKSGVDYVFTVEKVYNSQEYSAYAWIVDSKLKETELRSKLTLVDGSADEVVYNGGCKPNW